MKSNPFDEYGAIFKCIHLTKNRCNIVASVCTGSLLDIRVDVDIDPNRSEDCRMTLVFGKNSDMIEYKINDSGESVIKVSGGFEIEALIRAFNIFLMAIDLAKGDSKK